MRFNNTFWNRRLPRYMGIFVLLLSFGAIFWLSRNVVLFQSKAALGNTPKDVQISNITQNSATISYVTDGSVVGSISYGKTPQFGQVALDGRDTQSPDIHIIHYITLSGLDPGTKYFFSIASGDGLFQNDKLPYELTTASAPVPNASKEFELAGKVTSDGSKPPTEAIVYVRSDDPVSGESQLISSLVKTDGSYNLSVKNLLKKDLSGVLDVKENSTLKMRIIDSQAESNVLLFASLGKSIPQVILSKDYDFTVSQLSTTTASESAKIPSFPVLQGGESIPSGPQILTPATNEKFEDQQPLFEGKALPQSDVEITIESDPIVTTVQSDPNGNWQFRPDVKLEPGVHKITIKTLNAEGILQTITRSFTVFAQGSQFVEPSISPTSPIKPSPTAIPTRSVPTATPLLTATTVPTTQPTLQPSIIVIEPSAIVTAPPVALSPTVNITVPPIPDSGSSALIFGIIGTILTIGIGGLIFLLI